MVIAGQRSVCVGPSYEWPSATHAAYLKDRCCMGAKLADHRRVRVTLPARMGNPL